MSMRGTLQDFVALYPDAEVKVRRPCEHVSSVHPNGNWDHWMCRCCDGERYIEEWIRVAELVAAGEGRAS